MDLPRIKDLSDLQAILDLMRKNDLAELEIEEEGRRLRLRKSEPKVQGAGVVLGAAAPAPVLGAPAPDPAFVVEPAEEDDELHVVRSPLVGIFYRAPSPEADPFVDDGDRVDEETVLCIVEAMKVMNEIRAGIRGVVREILVKNGDAVEFGQPLVRVQTE